MASIPDVAIGAITAALIAGLVSLLGLIVSKEQKVSDFRQAWIDDLRSEIALLIAHGNAIHGSLSVGWVNIADAWKDIRVDYVGINEAAGRIRLRLNPKEPESRQILKTIEELETILRPSLKAPDYVKLNATEKRLVDETNAVLKSEWRRVKGGECVYQVAKYVALFVVVSALIGGSVFAYNAAHVFGSQNSPPSVPIH